MFSPTFIHLGSPRMFWEGNFGTEEWAIFNICLCSNLILQLSLYIWSGGWQHGAFPGYAGYGASSRNDKVWLVAVNLEPVSSLLCCLGIWPRDVRTFVRKFKSSAPNLGGRRESVSPNNSYCGRQKRHIEYRSSSLIMQNSYAALFGSVIQTRGTNKCCYAVYYRYAVYDENKKQWNNNIL